MKRLKMLQVVAILVVGVRTVPLARAQLYVGVLAGVATLSGDARSLINPGSTAFSSYDPKNGGAVEVLVGRHFSDYFAVQGNYIWNGNRLTLTSGAFNNGTQQAALLVGWYWPRAFCQFPGTARASAGIFCFATPTL